MPQNWQDLLKPAYAGHIGITSPSRSGTTHLIVEALLQAYGWERGWALLSEIGGNLSTVTARSFGVASGVAQRRFGIGVTIDFLAKAPDVAGGENVFALTPDPIYVPANIAILSRARNGEAAERFVDFLFSAEGQGILLRPAIGRIPVRAELNAGLLPPESTGGLLAANGFDARLSAERYGIVNLIFDDYIVRRRAMLARLWARLREFEGQAPGDAARQSTLASVRRLLGTPPLSAGDVEKLADDLKGEWPRGMVFQSYALWPHMTVARNVAFGLEERRLPRAEVEKRVAAALALVGLSHLADRRPSQLSGGQQQRVALARTIAIEPKVLLLDDVRCGHRAFLLIELLTVTVQTRADRDALGHEAGQSLHALDI